MTNNYYETSLLIGLLSDSTLLTNGEYKLDEEDFSNFPTKTVFKAIKTLYDRGERDFSTTTIGVFIDGTGEGARFEKEKGVELLRDIAEGFGTSFDLAYAELKKRRLVKDLKFDGFDVEKALGVSDDTDLFDEDFLKARKIYDKMTANDVLDFFRNRLAERDKQYRVDKRYDELDVETAFDNLFDGEEKGVSIQGRIFSGIFKGLHKGRLMLRGGGSGVGKTKSSLGDAFYLAYPFVYAPQRKEWVRRGHCHKVLMICDEQSTAEISPSIIAYLAKVNVEDIQLGNLTPEQKKICEQAIKVAKYYKDNLEIVHLPGSNVDAVKAVIRQKVLEKGIEYVMFDYIKGNSTWENSKFRNDELLAFYTSELKNLAIELNIGIIAGIQLNGNQYNPYDGIRNEGALAGGRATINACDYGVCIAKPTLEEIATIKKHFGKEPTLVADVFKNRHGRYTQVKVFSRFDKGTCRKEDICMTYGNLQPIAFEEDFEIYELDDEVALEKDYNNIISSGF